MSHIFNTNIFREYDIRGTFDTTLFTSDIYEVGFRLAAIWHHQGMVCVGRDGRLSSPELAMALIEGLREGGMDVLDIGVGPTPMLYYATRITPAIAGMMITGSHNPPGDNGLKITLKNTPFFGEQIQEILKVTGKKAPNKGTLEHIDLRQVYVTQLLENINLAKKPMKIAWDPGNGAAGEVTELLTAHLTGEHFLINSQIDGQFPAHHPDPSVEANLQQLQQVVATHACDMGIAFDGDGDRIGVIDNLGRMVVGDQLLTILALDVIAHNPGAKIIADVKCSQGFFDTVSLHGGQPIMCKTGHSIIKSQMAATQALLAGELSGHIFYADKYHGFDDALYAAVRLLQILCKSEKSLSAMIAALPQFMSTPEIKTVCADDKKFKVVNCIKESLNHNKITFIDIDGVRVESADGWWLIRASNTGPNLISRCEAKNQESLTILQQTMNGYLNSALERFS